MAVSGKSLCVGLLLAAVGCADGTGPGLRPFRYELVRVDDQPLPVVVATGTLRSATPGAPDATCQSRLLSRRIDFAGGGRYTMTGSAILACGDGRPDVKSEGSERGSYALSADTVVMTSDHSRFDDSFSVSSGVRTGLELRVNHVGPLYGSGYGDIILDTRTYVYRASR